VFLKKSLPFLLAFVLPLVLVYAWWGGFNPVDIREDTAGPYTYAYLEQKGDYSKLPDLADQVYTSLKADGIQPGLPITVLYSNPDLVAVNDRLGRTGFLVAPGSQPKPPLAVDTIPLRRVLAIIITIMVLELGAPHGDSISDLLPLLPTFLSYVLSFLYVGIYWNNHHPLLQAAKGVNGSILWANMHLLFWMSTIPFTTSWMGEHFASTPVAIYGAVLWITGLAYYILSRALVVNLQLRQALGGKLLVHHVKAHESTTGSQRGLAHIMRVGVLE